MELGKFSLKDDISSVAEKMQKSLKGLDDSVNKMFAKSKGNMSDFTKELKASGVAAVDASLLVSKYARALADARRESLGLVNTTSRLRSSISQVGIGALRGVGEKMLSMPATLLGGAVNVVEGIGSKIVEVGKDLVGAVISAAEFRQNALSGLEYMLGSREQAVDIFKQAQALAKETPLDTDKVIGGIKQLVTAGFSGKESMTLFKSVADQAAKYADDEGMQDKVIQAFSRIKGRGVATGEDLESLRVAGFRAESIVQELLNNKGLAPAFSKIKMDSVTAGGKAKFVDQSKATQEAILKQVKEVMGKGQVGVYTLLNAAIASQEKGGKKIGDFAKTMGGSSLTGTISNFKSAFGDLLKSVDVQSWKGVQAFQGFLTRVSDALGGDVGKGLLKTIQDIIDALLGGLDKIGDKDIAGMVSRIAELGQSAVGVIKEAWGWLDRLLHGGDIGDDLGDILIDVAKYIGAGIWEGVKNAGSIMREREGEKAAKFQAKYGVSMEVAKAKASSMGMNMSEFTKMLGGARKAFIAQGGGVDMSKTSEISEWRSKQASSGFGALFGKQTLTKSLDEVVLDAMLAADSRVTASSLPMLNSRATGATDAFNSSTMAMRGPYDNMFATGKDAALGFEQGAREQLDSHSPSRTMAQVGEDAAMGLIMGTREGNRKGQQEGTGGRGGVVVHVGGISVGDVGGRDPDVVGMAIAASLERELTNIFERKAAEG